VIDQGHSFFVVRARKFFSYINNKWLRKSPFLMLRVHFFRLAITNACYALARSILPCNERIGFPRGTFSLVELLRGEKLRGRVICDKQELPRFVKASMVRRCRMKQDNYQPWPIFWSEHRQARLVGPTLALMDERQRLAIESLFGPWLYSCDPSYRSWKRPDPILLGGSWTSLKMQFGNGFYHWLMDVLPRLAVLDELPADIKILVPAQLASFEQEALELLGLKDRVRPTPETHLVVEHYFFCSPTGMTGGMNPYAVESLRKLLLNKKNPTFSGPTQFYIPRTGTRVPVNSRQICAFFESLGWSVVYPEKMTLAQQIALFSKANAVCADHGAALTNLVFAPSSCRVLELFADNFLNACYEIICAARGISYRHLIFEADELFQPHIDLSILEREASDLFQE
jgi:hypothetical protein